MSLEGPQDSESAEEGGREGRRVETGPGVGVGQQEQRRDGDPALTCPGHVATIFVR